MVLQYVCVADAASIALLLLMLILIGSHTTEAQCSAYSTARLMKERD